MKTERKASVKTLIREAELVTAPNDFVYRFYLEQSKLDEISQNDDVDEVTEQRLLDKNDAFIDITLAQYCFFPETLGTLFKKSKENANLALTLACISNSTVSSRNYALVNPPGSLFDGSNGREEIDAWFKTIKNAEIDALFRNPTISDDFLTDVLEGKQFGSEMTDEQRTTTLLALCNNPRISTGYDNHIMDGFREYSHGRVPNAIWHLAESLPVEKRWAVILGKLLDKVVGRCREMDMLEVAKRWNVDDEDEKPEKKKQFLNPFESVRYALYKQSGAIKQPYGKDRAEIKKQYLSNDDLAFRAAAYNHLQLTADEIKSAYEKDALVAIQYAMENDWIWNDASSRQALHDIAWDADTRYNNNYLDCANQFNWRKKDVEKKHPDWFIEKAEERPETEVDETKQVVTVSLAKELLADSNANPALQYLELIHKLVSNSDKHIGKLNWIFWGLVLLLVFVLHKP